LKNISLLAVLLILYVVFPRATSDLKATDPPQPKVHTYYIAADEVAWDYAPRGRNLIGLPGPENEDISIGTKFQKAVYREYTDATFKTLKPRSPQWEHLGILGPLMRAEVGDVIKVVFKNNAKIFGGLHSHGLAYGKDSEGAVYNDGVLPERKRGYAIPPGQVFTYTWTVPERAGPGPADPSSILWVYHTDWIQPRDMNAGLFGAIIVSRKGSTKPDGTPKDVDREFIVAFAVFDETESWYFEANTKNQRKYTQGLRFSDPVLRQRYLFYSLNGYIGGNLPIMTMKQGERVRWYLLANSNDDDVHAPHWHGQTVTFNDMRTDTVHLVPMTTVVADMEPDNPGTWLFNCQVNEHVEGGMAALFTVTP
jgi:manganese oxidase